ncbi:putative serine/arginine repetitive matrix protein 2 [Blattamonas nauphoetae]|uniref:Serine/arginine repetitive matrix protein 2 n=1 Tax=Blattamonas nauphoetae TaxID=2049346 RepID=A0ABQ9YLI5_9EUKA|nr:putative serine/arginine repetitive matrix protein 2 [Blattamonas nauphoetae]
MSWMTSIIRAYSAAKLYHVSAICLAPRKNQDKPYRWDSSRDVEKERRALKFKPNEVRSLVFRMLAGEQELCERSLHLPDALGKTSIVCFTDTSMPLSETVPLATSVIIPRTFKPRSQRSSERKRDHDPQQNQDETGEVKDLADQQKEGVFLKVLPLVQTNVSTSLDDLQLSPTLFTLPRPSIYSPPFNISIANQTHNPIPWGFTRLMDWKDEDARKYQRSLAPMNIASLMLSLYHPTLCGDPISDILLAPVNASGTEKGQQHQLTPLFSVYTRFGLVGSVNVSESKKGTSKDDAEKTIEVDRTNHVILPHGSSLFHTPTTLFYSTAQTKMNENVKEATKLKFEEELMNDKEGLLLSLVVRPRATQTNDTQTSRKRRNARKERRAMTRKTKVKRKSSSDSDGDKTDYHSSSSQQSENKSVTSSTAMTPTTPTSHFARELEPLQLYSVGTPFTILENCVEYFDGEEIRPLDDEQRKRIISTIIRIVKGETIEDPTQPKKSKRRYNSDDPREDSEESKSSLPSVDSSHDSLSLEHDLTEEQRHNLNTLFVGLSFTTIDERYRAAFEMTKEEKERERRRTRRADFENHILGREKEIRAEERKVVREEMGYRSKTKPKTPAPSKKQKEADFRFYDSEDAERDAVAGSDFERRKKRVKERWWREEIVDEDISDARWRRHKRAREFSESEDSSDRFSDSSNTEVRSKMDRTHQPEKRTPAKPHTKTNSNKQTRKAPPSKNLDSSSSSSSSTRRCCHHRSKPIQQPTPIKKDLHYRTKIHTTKKVVMVPSISLRVPTVSSKFHTSFTHSLLSTDQSESGRPSPSFGVDDTVGMEWLSKGLLDVPFEVNGQTDSYSTLRNVLTTIRMKQMSKLKYGGFDVDTGPKMQSRPNPNRTVTDPNTDSASQYSVFSHRTHSLQYIVPSPVPGMNEGTPQTTQFRSPMQSLKRGNQTSFHRPQKSSQASSSQHGSQPLQRKSGSLTRSEAILYCQSQQVFLGFIAFQQFPIRSDVKGMVERLEKCGIRFVLFSSDEDPRATQLGQDLGVYTDWNSCIPLSSTYALLKTPGLPQKKTYQPPLRERGDEKVLYDMDNLDSVIASTLPLHRLCVPSHSFGSTRFPKMNYNVNSRGQRLRKQRRWADTLSTFFTQTDLLHFESAIPLSLASPFIPPKQRTLQQPSLSTRRYIPFSSALYTANSLAQTTTVANFHCEEDLESSIPKGIDALKTHLVYKDDVPLRVQLFSSTNPMAVKEMISLYRSFGENVTTFTPTPLFNEQAHFSLRFDKQWPLEAIPVIIPHLSLEEAEERDAKKIQEKEKKREKKREAREKLEHERQEMRDQRLDQLKKVQRRKQYQQELLKQAKVRKVREMEMSSNTEEFSQDQRRGHESSESNSSPESNHQRLPSDSTDRQNRNNEHVPQGRRRSHRPMSVTLSPLVAPQHSPSRTGASRLKKSSSRVSRDSPSSMRDNQDEETIFESDSFSSLSTSTSSSSDEESCHVEYFRAISRFPLSRALASFRPVLGGGQHMGTSRIIVERRKNFRKSQIRNKLNIEPDPPNTKGDQLPVAKQAVKRTEVPPASMTVDVRGVRWERIVHIFTEAKRLARNSQSAFRFSTRSALSITLLNFICALLGLPPIIGPVQLAFHVLVTIPILSTVLVFSPIYRDQWKEHSDKRYPEKLPDLIQNLTVIKALQDPPIPSPEEPQSQLTRSRSNPSRHVQTSSLALQASETERVQSDTHTSGRSESDDQAASSASSTEVVNDDDVHTHPFDRTLTKLKYTSTGRQSTDPQGNIVPAVNVGEQNWRDFSLSENSPSYPQGILWTRKCFPFLYLNPYSIRSFIAFFTPLALVLIMDHAIMLIYLINSPTFTPPVFYQSSLTHSPPVTPTDGEIDAWECVVSLSQSICSLLFSIFTCIYSAQFVFPTQPLKTHHPWKNEYWPRAVIFCLILHAVVSVVGALLWFVFLFFTDLTAPPPSPFFAFRLPLLIPIIVSVLAIPAEILLLVITKKRTADEFRKKQDLRKIFYETKLGVMSPENL